MGSKLCKQAGLGSTLVSASRATGLHGAVLSRLGTFQETTGSASGL